MCLKEEIIKLTASINKLNKILMSTNKPIQPQKDYVSVSVFCKNYGISRGLFYKNIGKFITKKVGSRTFVLNNFS